MPEFQPPESAARRLAPLYLQMQMQKKQREQAQAEQNRRAGIDQGIQLIQAGMSPQKFIPFLRQQYNLGLEGEQFLSELGKAHQQKQKEAKQAAEQKADVTPQAKGLAALPQGQRAPRREVLSEQFGPEGMERIRSLAEAMRAEQKGKLEEQMQLKAFGAALDESKKPSTDFIKTQDHLAQLEDKLDATTDPRERERISQRIIGTKGRLLKLASPGQSFQFHYDPITQGFSLVQGPPGAGAETLKNAQVNEMQTKVSDNQQAMALIDNMLTSFREDPSRVGFPGLVKGLTTKAIGAVKDVDLLLGAEGQEFIDRGREIIKNDVIQGREDAALLEKFYDPELSTNELFSSVAAFLIARELKVGRGGTERNMRRFEKMTSFKGITSGEQMMKKLEAMRDILHKRQLELSRKLQRLEVQPSTPGQFKPTRSEPVWRIENGRLIEGK